MNTGFGMWGNVLSCMRFDLGIGKYIDTQITQIYHKIHKVLHYARIFSIPATIACGSSPLTVSSSFPSLKNCSVGIAVTPC